MDKKMKIIALIALLAYVISPVDLAPGPMDDMIMCLLYAIMLAAKYIFVQARDVLGGLSHKKADPTA